MKSVARLAAASVAMAAVSGCVSVPSKGGFTELEQLVGQRLDAQVHWYQGTPEDREVAERVGELLLVELSLHAAIQIALLNNRSLQASYEELGVAQADLVQAGLLRNPVFFASARYPDGSALTTNTELGVVQDFLDLLVRPARKRIASLEFEETKLRVADAVLVLAADVKASYYTLQASLQVAEMLRVIARAAEAAYEFARRQNAAGTLNDLDLASQQALYEQARIDLARAEAAVVAGRERLNRLLGLWGVDTTLTVPGRLPPILEEEPPLGELEALAVTNRLDLAVARLEVEQLAQALQLTVRWRYVAVAEVGISTEKEADGVRVSGPSLAIELPIFDQGQARIARTQALSRRSQQRMMALAIDIRSQVREARNRLLVERQLARHYEQVLIPVRERVVAEAMKHYNFMLLGVYRLLEAKRDEVAAYREYIEVTRDYWLARTELELAVGGSLAADNRRVDSAGETAPLTPEGGDLHEGNGR